MYTTSASNPKPLGSRQSGRLSIYFLYLFGSCRSCMRFEFDPRKSAANRAKHGIDFVAAQAMWLDESLLEIPAKTLDEARWLVIARIGSRAWSAVITRRLDVIRIISVRRARQEEVVLYEGADTQSES